MHTHQAFIRAVFPAIILLATIPSYASGNLSADEIRSLFSGNTVEGDHEEGRSQGMSSFYSEPFVNYFADDGKVYSVTGKTDKSGVWRATEEGLCINWNNTKENCAPVYKERDHYKQQKKNNTGKVKWSKTYTTFTPGDIKSLRDK
ncbi:MAG: hypothetical protein WBO37_14070 [Gammaproteobacteria bacterium]